MREHPEDTLHAPHPSKTVAAHTLAWVLVCVAVVDGSGYVYGNSSVTSSQTYELLRLIPGGMRTWGVLLLVGAMAVAWGIGRDGRGHDRALNVTLTVGVGYYLLWCGVIVGGWIRLGEIPAWGALSKFALLAALYYMCARAVAPTHESWLDRVLHKVRPPKVLHERG